MAFRVYRPYPFPDRVDPKVIARLDRLGARFETELHAETDAIVALLRLRIDGALLDSAPKVRAVCNVAVGYDNVDVPAATARGVVVTNTPDVLTEATADVAWTLLLAAARRMTEGDRFVRAGRWQGWDWTGFRGLDLVGKTLGILGAGRIGEATARRALGFRMKVLYTARHRKPSFEKSTGGKRASMEALLRRSDFVSVHVPLSKETIHLIGTRELSMMKPSAVLVNTARGPIVDEAALVDALRAGRIAAAGLDVFEEEPKVHPGLIGLENVALLPHVGSATDETRSAMYQTALVNLIAVLSGKRPPNAVNPEALRRQ